MLPLPHCPNILLIFVIHGGTYFRISTTKIAYLGKIQFVQTAQKSNYFPLFETSLFNYPRTGQSVKICFSPPVPPDIVRVIYIGGKLTI
jgi:hypothetical protein